MVAAWKEEMKRWKNILLISYVLLHLMWLAPRSVLKRANYDYYDNIVSTTLTEMGLGVADQLGAM